ncbi:hypothetical protein GF351_02870, partial [Candidatus Woesearchaeota archaeon]|nr:hypothetical protein [Candidatus Woesearchaeota archaeon]
SRQTLLVIAPHQDDETIGCGGLIAKVKEAGGKVYVLAITLGNSPQYGANSDTETRKKEFEKAMTVLQVDGHGIAFIDDKYHLMLDTIPQKELINCIESKSEVSLNNVKPSMVALPFPSYMQDHKAVFHAGLAACRPRPRQDKHLVDTVLVYRQPDDSWSTDSFIPSFLVDISNQLSKKMEALSCYSSQIHPEPHARSVENIKRICCINGTLVGAKSAEAFMCLRHVI